MNEDTNYHGCDVFRVDAEASSLTAIQEKQVRSVVTTIPPSLITFVIVIKNWFSIITTSLPVHSISLAHYLCTLQVYTCTTKLLHVCLLFLMPCLFC